MERSVTTHPPSYHTHTIETVIHVMKNHLCEPLTLEDLADAACMSPFYFHRTFRQLIGLPPGEFLTALRLQEARRLLLTTSLNVIDICFEVGYNSPGTFTTRFTHLTGLSPRLLRQQAHRFAPDESETVTSHSLAPVWRTHLPLQTLRGTVSATTSFQGTIYLGLFQKAVAQGMPVSCTRLSRPGPYVLRNIPDGTYYLLAAAFPQASDWLTALLPGEQLLVGLNAEPLTLGTGQISGNPDLVLHPPRLTDPPLVMALPLL